jgi:hypothetical protein
MYRKHLAVLFFAVLMPAVAAAQNETHWGVAAAFTPQWKVPSQLEELFDGTVDLKGTDFAIGIVRGRHRGGDWGLSFIHKRVKDGSRVEKFEEECEFTNGCFLDGTSFVTRGVAINGVELHKYIPFGTIKERVQIGMNFAGGVGRFTGDLEERQLSAELIPGARFPGPGMTVETVTTEPASELLGTSTVPLLKLQLAVGFIVNPSFKLRVQGGLDLPGYELFSVTGVVFFGAR